MSVTNEIAAERARQITKGYDAAHDDGHRDGEIATAAACYAAMHDLVVMQRDFARRGSFAHPKRLWPWVLRPSGNRRERLIKAGALIVAEIERLDRAALSHNGTRKER